MLGFIQSWLYMRQTWGITDGWVSIYLAVCVCVCVFLLRDLPLERYGIPPEGS